MGLSQRPREASETAFLASVIITAHDAAATIPLLLADLVAQQGAGPFEVILVADRCRDATETAASLGPLPVRILRQSETPGKGCTSRQQALQLGVSAAKGELLLFTDADSRVPRDWIRRVRGHLALYDVYCGPVQHQGQSRIWSTYLTLDAAFNLGMYRCLHALGLRSGGFGANLAVRRGYYNTSGGFARQAPTLTEDRALVQQLESAGARILHAAAPAVRVCSVSGPASIIERGRRVMSGDADPAGLVMTLGGLSLLVPPAAALLFGGPWYEISVGRYLFGVLVFLACALRVGAVNALPWTLFYEPIAVGIAAATLHSVARDPRVRWGGLEYRLPLHGQDSDGSAGPTS